MVEVACFPWHSADRHNMSTMRCAPRNGRCLLDADWQPFDLYTVHICSLLHCASSSATVGVCVCAICGQAIVLAMALSPTNARELPHDVSLCFAVELFVRRTLKLHTSCTPSPL